MEARLVKNFFHGFPASCRTGKYHVTSKVTIVGLTGLANETTVCMAFSISSSKFYSNV